jgi:hypothetical protein
MAFAEPFVIDYISGADPTFVTTSGGTQFSSHRLDTLSTEAERKTLRILHADGAKNKATPGFFNERHILTLSHDEFNSVANRREVASVGCTISMPNSGYITRAELDEQIKRMYTFLQVAANIDKLLRKEI